MTAVTAVLRRLSLVLGAGYVLFFFSERLFWSFWRPGDELVALLGGWLLYALLGYLLLAVLALTKLRSLAALVVLGSGFGWLNEGVFAMTLFGDPSMPFPLTLAWTALAWHMPLSVLVGLVGLRLALQRPGIAASLGFSVAIGLFWGLWSVAWGRETPPLVADEIDFLLHAGLATLVLALAQRAIDAGRADTFRPARWSLIICVGLVLAFFILITVPAIPWSPLVLVPLMALVAVALRRMREHDERLIAIWAQPVVARNLLALAVLPLVATATYGGLNAAGWLIPSHEIVALVMGPLGTCLLIVALVRLFRAPQREATTTPTMLVADARPVSHPDQWTRT